MKKILHFIISILLFCLTSTGFAADTQGINNYRVLWETPFIEGIMKKAGNFPESQNKWPDYIINEKPKTISTERLFELIVFDEKGRIIRRVHLGPNPFILSDNLSHYTLRKELIWESGEYEVTIKGISGNTVGKIDSTGIPRYLGKDGYPLLTTGGKKPSLNVFNKDYELTAQHIADESQCNGDMGFFPTMTKLNTGYAADLCGTLIILNQNGDLLFRSAVEDILGGRPFYGSTHFRVLNDKYFFFAKEYRGIPKELRNDILKDPNLWLNTSSFDVEGREHFLNYFNIPYDLNWTKFFVSPAGDYLAAVNDDRISTFTKEGVNLCSLLVSTGRQGPPEGFIDDKGMLILAHPSYTNFQLFTRECKRVDLGIPVPVGTYDFNHHEGLSSLQPTGFSGRYLDKKYKANDQESTDIYEYKLSILEIKGKASLLIDDTNMEEVLKSWHIVDKGKPESLEMELDDNISVTGNLYKIGFIEVISPLEIRFHNGGDSIVKSFFPKSGRKDIPRPVTVYASPNKEYYALITVFSSEEENLQTYNLNFFNRNGLLVWSENGTGQNDIKELDRTKVIVRDDGTTFFINPSSNKWERRSSNGELSFSNKLTDEEHVYGYAIVNGETGRYLCISMPYNIYQQPLHAELVLLDLAGGTKVWHKTIKGKLAEVMLVYEKQHLVITRIAGRSLIAFDFNGKQIWEKEWKDWIRAISVDDTDNLKITFNDRWELVNSKTLETINAGKLE